MKPLAAVFAALLSISLSGCSDTYSFRYRLTLEIETPEGIKTGSSVLQGNFASSENSLFQGFRGAGGDVHGEAVAVDLGARGLLIALLVKLSNDEGDQLRYLANLPAKVTTRTGLVKDGRLGKAPRYKLYTDYMREVAAVRGSIELLPAELPTLVRFLNVENPRSIRLVQLNALEESFGVGVRLHRATIEITNDPVSSGLEDKLRWLKGMVGTLERPNELVAGTSTNDLEDVLGRPAFIRYN